MDDFSFKSISEILSVLGGISSIVAVIISLLFQFIIRKRKLNVAAEKEFNEIIKSDDINRLGSYLDDVIGKFTIYEYSSDSSISQRIDKYLEKITDFVGTNEEISKEEEPEFETPILDTFPVSEEYEKIIIELREGEAWNALARLRRLIEMKLKTIAIDHHIDIEKIKSAGQILYILHKKQIVDAKIYQDLRYAIFVSNKAIHGEDIKSNVAEEAIYVAARALNNYENNYRNT